MIVHETLLVTLVHLVERRPALPSPVRRGRGRPPTDPDRLVLQALGSMIVRHLHPVHALLSVLAQPTPEMQTLRAVLTGDGRFPTRRTWERRLQVVYLERAAKCDGPVRSRRRGVNHTVVISPTGITGPR